MSEFTLFTHPMSGGRIVRWMLEEIGIGYRVEVIDISADRKPAGFLAMNPMGKVPVLQHGNTIITECAAICAYLADAFPAAGLAPPQHSEARGDYYRWLFFAAGPFDTATTLETMAFKAPPYGEVRAPWGSLDRVIEVIEHALSTCAWLSGDRFSAADLYLGARLDWAIQFGVVSARPAFSLYLDRVLARPAAIRAANLDDALASQLSGS